MLLAPLLDRPHDRDRQGQQGHNPRVRAVHCLLHASRTPRTRLLHASYTPLTRLAPLLQDNKCTKDVFGLCIGFAVVVGGYAIGPISGANLNPAVSWGITATHTSSFDNAVAYTIIQVLRPHTLVA